MKMWILKDTKKPKCLEKSKSKCLEKSRDWTQESWNLEGFNRHLVYINIIDFITLFPEWPCTKNVSH